MSAKYGTSTYGKTMLIDEGFDTVPTLRYVYILINVLLYGGPMVYLTAQYFYMRSALLLNKRRRLSQNALSLLTATFIAFAVNNTLRGSHMIDHICRPVYYHEPKWAYAKIWITEMEIPTYSNILTSIIILQGMGRLLTVIVQGNRQGLNIALGVMTLYVANALFNLIHYTIEPPSNYGPFPNFNIAGTGLTTLPLIFMLVRIYLKAPSEKSEQLIAEASPSEHKMTTRSSARKRTPVRK